MSVTMVIDDAGCSSLATYVQARLGRLPAMMVDDARRIAPKDTTALMHSGRVQRLGPELWRIIFGEGLPDGRAVYQELGTSRMQAQPYIRPTVYRARSL